MRSSSRSSSVLYCGTVIAVVVVTSLRIRHDPESKYVAIQPNPAEIGQYAHVRDIRNAVSYFSLGPPGEMDRGTRARGALQDRKRSQLSLCTKGGIVPKAAFHDLLAQVDCPEETRNHGDHFTTPDGEDHDEVSTTENTMDALSVIVQISMLLFVVSSMLAMGFSLTVPQIIAPLKNMKLVLLALAVNFIVVPLVAVAIQAVMNLDQDIYTGILLIATAAGAPFLPKLAGIAKGDAAFSVGLMVLLMVVTVAYMPIVLPLLLSGVTINPWDIAKSLIFLMLLPLGIALVVKARWSDIAEGLQPMMAQTSSISIMLLLVGGVILSWDSIISLIGTGGLIAIVIFLLVSLVVGYFAGGSDPATRSVMGLGTAQRNLSAALVVAAQNFSSTPTVTVTVVVAAMIGLVLLIPIGGELGRHMTSTGSSTKESQSSD